MTDVTAGDQSEAPASGAGKTVLVVEDNDLNMVMFDVLLDARGYRVLQAANGMAGWRLAQEHRPDLILMDIQLPDVSGLEVTKWLKRDEALRSIPIIAVTAFAMVGDKEKHLEAGCDAYISKPVSVSDFVRIVGQVASGSYDRRETQAQEPGPAKTASMS